jgi:hypothetical protein
LQVRGPGRRCGGRKQVSAGTIRFRNILKPRGVVLNALVIDPVIDLSQNQIGNEDEK